MTNNPLNRYVTLVMDEVHIKEDLVYNKHQGHLIGFVDLGNANNKLLEFEAATNGDTDRPLANSMLVFMVRGLFSNLAFPYVQFSCNNLTGDLLVDPVWEAISRLERMGFQVMSLTCDGASTNRRFWQLHSEESGVVYKVPNVYASEPCFLYFISDPPHLIKTIRNSWNNRKRKLWVRLTINLNVLLNMHNTLV